MDNETSTGSVIKLYGPDHSKPAEHVPADKSPVGEHWVGYFIGVRGDSGVRESIPLKFINKESIEKFNYYLLDYIDSIPKFLQESEEHLAKVRAMVDAQDIYLEIEEIGLDEDEEDEKEAFENVIKFPGSTRVH